MVVEISQKNERNSMKFLLDKYGNHFIYKGDKVLRKISNLFRDIWQCKNHPSLGRLKKKNIFKWDEKILKFWFDIWFEDSPVNVKFQRLFNLSKYKEILIIDMVRLCKILVHVWQRNLIGWKIDSSHSLAAIAVTISFNDKPYELW